MQAAEEHAHCKGALELRFELPTSENVTKTRLPLCNSYMIKVALQTTTTTMKTYFLNYYRPTVNENGKM